MDPNIASQTALLQGMAGFHPLDAVLREDRLAEGLAFLAAETGVAPPAALPVDPDRAALAAIHDHSLEEAAADAYGRDYTGIGFGRWQG